MILRNLHQRLKEAAPYLFFGLFLWGILWAQAHAAGYLGDDWDKYLGGLRTFAASDKTGEELAIDFVRNLVRIVRYLIGGAALIVAILYGLYLVTAAGKEDKITKVKEQLVWLVLGFVILILAENVAVLLKPGEASSGALIDYEAANDQLRSIVNYFKYLFGSILLIMMIVSGAKLIVSRAEEEKITHEKRNLVYSFMGMLVVMLADNIVDAIYVVKSPAEFTPGDTGNTVVEIAGVIKLLLAFLGPLAVAMTILAGFYYVTALDDEEKTKKARTLIISGVTGIIFIYGATALVNTIIQGQLPVS